jgi:hypothetical protein
MVENPQLPNPFGDQPQSVNPYASPQFVEPVASAEAVRGRLLAPAIILIVLSAISLIAYAASLAIRLLAGTIVPDQMDSSAKVGYLVGTFLPPLCNLVTLLGAVDMLRMRKYRNAMTAAIIACIPLCSSCLVLGIPFGIWAIVILRQPETIAAFGAAAKTHS